MECCTGINNKHAYTFCMKHSFYMFQTANMLMAENSEITMDRFNTTGIYVCEHYAQK